MFVLKVNMKTKDKCLTKYNNFFILKPVVLVKAKHAERDLAYYEIHIYSCTVAK